MPILPEQLTLSEYLRSPPLQRSSWYLIFGFLSSILFVFLFSISSLYCVSFILRLLLAPLVSSNYFVYSNRHCSVCLLSRVTYKTNHIVRNNNSVRDWCKTRDRPLSDKPHHYHNSRYSMNDMTNKFNEDGCSGSYLNVETFTQTGYNRKRTEARKKTSFVHRQKGGGQQMTMR